MVLDKERGVRRRGKAEGAEGVLRPSRTITMGRSAIAAAFLPRLFRQTGRGNECQDTAQVITLAGSRDRVTSTSSWNDMAGEPSRAQTGKGTWPERLAAALTAQRTRNLG